MELSFELLREAGVRLPGAMGNTIGIVGGLIIGQAAGGSKSCQSDRGHRGGVYSALFLCNSK